MNTTTMLRVAALTMLGAAMAAVPAEAQFGRLKDRLKDAAAGAAVDRALGGGGNGAEAGGPKYGDRVVEITPEVLVRFEAVVSSEAEERNRALRVEQEREAASRRVEAWDECVEEVQDQHAARMEALGRRHQLKVMSGDLKAIQAMTDSIGIIQKEAAAAAEKKCGAPPEERGSAAGSRSSRGGSAAGTGATTREERLKRHGFRESQFSVMQERITYFCNNVVNNQPQPRSGTLVFSEVETTAVKPRCAHLLPLLQ
jgi:uncharacterized protein YciI